MTPRILLVTPEMAREHPHLSCGRCGRAIRVLDNVVQYPVQSVPLDAKGALPIWLTGIPVYMLICETCLDLEISASGWTPPEGI